MTPTDETRALADEIESQRETIRSLHTAIDDLTRAGLEMERAKNEEIDRLREDLAWMTAEAHAQREAAIYGAVFAREYQVMSTDYAVSYAEAAVEEWRAAQKGGSDD